MHAAFFRVLQESLRNIARHAKTSPVRVELRQQGDMLTMAVSDNGVGLPDDSRNKAGSFGLAGLEERTTILGGQCSKRQPGGRHRLHRSGAPGPGAPEEQPGRVKQASATVS